MHFYVTRQYKNIDKGTIDLMLSKLRSQGAITKGRNPWQVELPAYSVKLTGSWDADKMILSIALQEVGLFIPGRTVWSTIDGMIAEISNAKTIQEPKLRTTSSDD